MSVEDRIRHFEKEIAKIDQQIMTGDTDISKLKKQRLRLKTQLVILKQDNLTPIYKTE